MVPQGNTRARHVSLTEGKASAASSGAGRIRGDLFQERHRQTKLNEPLADQMLLVRAHNAEAVAGCRAQRTPLWDFPARSACTKRLLMNLSLAKSDLRQAREASSGRWQGAWKQAEENSRETTWLLLAHDHLISDAICRCLSAMRARNQLG